jgi:hypothetical protein
MAQGRQPNTSNQGIRWATGPSKPLLNLSERKYIDESKFAANIEAAPVNPNRSRGSTPITPSSFLQQSSLPSNFRPVPTDSTGTRLIFDSRGIIGKEFSPSRKPKRSGRDSLGGGGNEEEKKLRGRVKQVFEDERDLRFSDYYPETDPNNLLARNYLSSQLTPSSTSSSFPREWVSVGDPTPREAARLSEMDARRRLSVITGGEDLDAKKQFTYPCLAYLKDGEKVAILYGENNSLYLLSHMTSAPKQVRGGASGVPTVVPRSEQLVIMNPSEAYNMNFGITPIYLVEGNPNTALTRQKIDDMQANSILDDLSIIYEQDLDYPRYIETLRTQGATEANKLSSGPLLSTIVSNYFKI